MRREGSNQGGMPQVALFDGSPVNRARVGLAAREQRHRREVLGELHVRAVQEELERSPVAIRDRHVDMKDVGLVRKPEPVGARAEHVEGDM